MNNVKKYVCEYCGSKFATEPNLKRHEKNALYCLKNRGNKNKLKILKGFECKYCFGKYSRKTTLTNHLSSCKQKSRYITIKRIKTKNSILKKINQKIKKQNSKFEECVNFYKQDNESLRENIVNLKKNNECFKNDIEIFKDNADIYKQKNKNLKKQIIELREKLAKKEGEVDGIIKAPIRNVSTTNKNINTTNKNTNTNTTYVNPKLMNINVENIEPLTIERIKKQISDGKFTDKHFEKGVDGIVEFLVPIMTLKRDDGTVERNYVCTDVSRNKFYRLEEGKIWKSDSGGLFIGKAINELGPSVNDSYRRLVDKKHGTDNEFAKEMYTKRINKLMPIFRASVHNFNDEFVEVLAKTKNKMKHHISV